MWSKAMVGMIFSTRLGFRAEIELRKRSPYGILWGKISKILPSQIAADAEKQVIVGSFDLFAVENGNAALQADDPQRILKQRSGHCARCLAHALHGDFGVVMDDSLVAPQEITDGLEGGNKKWCKPC